MKIAESSVQFQSEHNRLEKHETLSSLSIFNGNDKKLERVSFNTNPFAAGESFSSASERRDIDVDLSDAARAMRFSKAKVTVAEDAILDAVDDMSIFMFKTLMEYITGRKINIVTPGDIINASNHQRNIDEGATITMTSQTGSGSTEFGLIYNHYETHYESESLAFEAQGQIYTEDGKQIDVAIDLNMSREFMSVSGFELRAGNAAALTDPLVINFNGTAAQLTQERFSFDLDLDGEEDQIAFVGEGSGFLTLDKNDDGIVNDGSELFGPTLGNGFEELAAYDEDGNQWIDENDPIFNRLRVWTKDAEGNDHLFALGKVGVGAIYLGNIDTPFQLKDTSNELQGAVRSTGIHVSEDGNVGTIQQIDLAV